MHFLDNTFILMQCRTEEVPHLELDPRVHECVIIIKIIENDYLKWREKFPDIRLGEISMAFTLCLVILHYAYLIKACGVNVRQPSSHT